jgi:5-methylcytosine-specific restriction endonuclease McrA
METKYCSTCEQTKEITEFSYAIKKTGKLQNKCKSCVTEYNIAYRNNPEKKIKILKLVKDYSQREDIKERRINYMNNWFNSENGKISINKYKSTTKFKNLVILYRTTINYKNSRIKFKSSDIGKASLKASRQKRRESELFDNYNKEDRLKTLNLFNNKCFNCDSTIKLEVDHHKPLSKGFGLSLTNAVLLCRSCNAKKYNKDPNQFYDNNQLRLLEENYGIIN